MPAYDDKIKELEEQISKTKYNKKTQHAIGLYKAQLARLKETQLKRSSGGKKGEGYSVKKSGDATVILCGFPSVGKSTLLNSLTGTESRVGAYAFTTLTVIPGLLEYKHAKIQVLDVPGIVHGAASGRGRGTEVLAVMRTADLAIVLIDVNYPGHLKVLKKEIYEAGLRLDERLPDVKIVKKSRGGVDIASTVKLTKTDFDTIKDVLREFRIHNADVVIRQDISIDQLIDVVEANKIYIPSLVVLNKIDMVPEKKLEELKKNLKPDVCVSAEEKLNIDGLKDAIFYKLNFIRVYTKEAGKKADMDVPMIMKGGSTIKDMCDKLHRDFVNKFRFARVWGKSAKFPGQKFTLNHRIMDGDVVEVHLR
ncbi:GTP-binding protein [Candidatus Woesearchaeota archaeon CG10_big_fil_rev_8_21_14_0_10_44_13]|nr:MAG: GTP-binding protein [Candidatus Woesearchaeota archaeon CG10_big_fil_rev_8_21_14_0_10_44_13]